MTGNKKPDSPSDMDNADNQNIMNHIIKTNLFMFEWQSRKMIVKVGK